MKAKSNHLKTNFLLLAVITALLASCCTKTVIVGSPYDRYDHNRTREIIIEAGTASQKIARDEIYAPAGSALFPKAEYKDDKKTDSLPAANVVPIFTGVSLPLSSSAVGGGQSDREDLIAFLAAGPLAQDGVKPGGMEQDNQQAEQTYKDILGFLEETENLSSERSVIIRKLSKLGIGIADELLDGRYRLRAFSDVLALKSGDFWFVLYKLPGNSIYSRLVVVPSGFNGQNFSGKRL